MTTPMHRVWLVWQDNSMEIVAAFVYAHDADKYAEGYIASRYDVPCSGLRAFVISPEGHIRSIHRDNREH